MDPAALEFACSGPGLTLVTGPNGAGKSSAARALAARVPGARVLSGDGRPFSEDSIGDALATRALQSDLRAMGIVRGGPRPLADKDRSRFLSRLDQIVQQALRERRSP